MSDDTSDLFPDSEAAGRFGVALRFAAGPASPVDELIERARRGAHRRARRNRRIAAGAGVVAAVLTMGVALSQVSPDLQSAPSASLSAPPSAPQLTSAERQQRADEAFRSSLAAAVPTFQVDGPVQVSASTWTQGGDQQEGWQSTVISKTLLPGTDTMVATSLAVSVAYSAQATSVMFPTCESSDGEHGLLIDGCTTWTSPEGTRVDSGTLTSTFWTQTQGESDIHQVSVTAPFATAWARDGVRVSAVGGVVDGMDVPLAMGTTLPAGSPLDAASLTLLVTQAPLLSLRR